MAETRITKIRKQQLIEAAITMVAKHGYTDVTITHVVEEAGLSRGIVNFYFDSKDSLMAEAARYLVASYLGHCFAKVKVKGVKGRGAKNMLHTLVEAHFHPYLFNRRIIGAFQAFSGEAKAKKVFRAPLTEAQNVVTDALQSLILQSGEEKTKVDTAQSAKKAKSKALLLVGLIQESWKRYLWDSRLEKHVAKQQCMFALELLLNAEVKRLPAKQKIASQDKKVVALNTSRKRKEQVTAKKTTREKNISEPVVVSEKQLSFF